MAVGEWRSDLRRAAVEDLRRRPRQVQSGMFGEEKIPDLGAEDIRFTSRWKTLYAIALDLPPEHSGLADQTTQHREALLAKGEIADVSLLGSDAKLSWEHSDVGLRINLPIAETRRPRLYLQNIVELIVIIGIVARP